MTSFFKTVAVTPEAASVLPGAAAVQAEGERDSPVSHAAGNDSRRTTIHNALALAGGPDGIGITLADPTGQGVSRIEPGVWQMANAAATADRVRTCGVGVDFITHNLRHATTVGDRLMRLTRSQILGAADRRHITAEDVRHLVAGGQQMAQLEASLGGRI